ncbi:MAG: chromatin modification- protein VID21 [Pycnora praestabilis]|nr:MAG: chromatin modification- protein VID21 [Pycnora praestabilis]
MPDNARDGILLSKRDEIADSVVSRKRKLRELYAVARYAEPVPQYRGLLFDDLPYDNGEIAFLDANDILKGRFFDEDTLPKRQQNIFDTGFRSKSIGAFVRSSKDRENVVGDAPIAVSKGVVGEIDLEVNGAIAKSHLESKASIENDIRDGATNTLRERPSMASQMDPFTIVASNNASINGSTANDGEDNAKSPHSGLPTNDLQRSLIASTLESENGSPGVDPAQVVPMSSEDAAGLPDSLVALSQMERESSGAKTVHLPSEADQQKHLREIERGQENEMRRERKEDEKPPPSAGTSIVNELPSSPVSTVGPHSTNTPGVDVASPDTSPDTELSTSFGNELQKSPRGPLPNGIGSSAKAEHDSLLKSQMEIARLNAFANGASTPDAQLRLEEQQAAQAPTVIFQGSIASSVLPNPIPSAGQSNMSSSKRSLTKRAQEFVQDVLEDEEDEVVGVPTPEDEADGGMTENGSDRTIIEGTANNGSCVDKTDDPIGKVIPSVQDSVGTLDSSTNPEEVSKNSAQRKQMLAPLQTSVSASKENETPTNDKAANGGLDSATEQLVLGEDIVMQDASPGVSRSSVTPRRAIPISTSMHSPPERMTTRVSSGALRHKSVSEILGETPKAVGGPNEKATADKSSTESSQADSATGLSTPASMSHRSPPPPTSIRNSERREKERSKLSTVVFAKQHRNIAESSILLRQNRQTSLQLPKERENYLHPLFVAQASSSQPRSHQLNTLLSSAHKTLSTANHYVDYHEQQDCRILKRIYQMQYAQRWSLRQMERASEPARPTTHWDVLLDQMKWMRTDFREERKWKIAAAKNLANWCAEWKASSPDDRVILQVKVKTAPIAKAELDSQDIEMDDQPFSTVEDNTLHSPPDLVSSAEHDSLSDALDEENDHLDLYNAVAPAAIFSLAAGDVIFDLKKTPASDRLLRELPIYEPTQEVPQADPLLATASPDAAWRTSIVPISKFTVGKMITDTRGPPRKRSRYEYEDEDEEADLLTRFDVSSGPQPTAKTAHYELSPEQQSVALFNPENKHIRDRIHAGHAFRPPSEHNMPSQNFFESRSSSQWTYEEDSELRNLVKDYSYNWSLISSLLSPLSIFSSGAERRTPWECFERWVGLEGLPADMQKTQYFRAYHSRLEAAQRNVVAQQQSSQAAPGNNTAQSLTPVRRRTTQPVRVERRKNNKHLALIDAMRKLAKKRETSIQKQQHAAGLAAQRKANEATQPRAPAHTPQDFSRMKYERECKIAERAEAYRQSVLASQTAAKQQRDVQRSNQQHALSNGALPQPRNGTPGSANVASPVVGSSFSNGNHPPSLPNQSRAHQSLQATSNGFPTQAGNGLPSNLNNVSVGMKSMPQAQMQAGLQAQQRLPHQMTPDNMRVFMEANRVQQEQQRFLQQQRQQQQQQQNHHFHSQPPPHNQPGPSSSPNMAALNNATQNNPAMFAALQAASHANGMSSPSGINGIAATKGSSASPRIAQSQPAQPQHLSNGMLPTVNAITHHLKSKNPQLSPEQITKLTNEHLQHRVSAQAAMTAAAGANMGSVNSNANHHAHQQNQQQPGLINGVDGGGMSQHQKAMYAQRMAAQQAHQSRGASTIPRPPSRSATPGAHRSSSVQGGAPGQNQSPRPPQAQMAGGQS